MRFWTCITLTTAMLSGIAGVAQAEPGGCLKYGAVGAVGGHIAGHHAVLGAAAGCAAGMYKRHEYRKHIKEQAAQAPHQN